MILAAGRGARLRPLTDKTPKPLINIVGLALIELHLLRLRQCGVDKVIINLAHLGEQIEKKLGDGKRYGLDIVYSPETQALETAGGIAKALPLITSDPFIVVNADIISDFDFSLFMTTSLPTSAMATLVMVANPPQHLAGDFHFKKGRLQAEQDTDSKTLTFSGIALYRKINFAALAIEKAPLAPLLNELIAAGQVDAIEATGLWQDIGTIDRLENARNSRQVQEYISSLRRSHKLSAT